MTGSGSQVVEYPFTIFLFFLLLFSWYFYHVELPLSLSLFLYGLSNNRKNHLVKYFENSYNRRLAKRFNGTSEKVCARNQISIIGDWILVRDNIIRGFPNGSCLARSCPIGSHWFRLIPTGWITMGDTEHTCVGAYALSPKNDITLHSKSRTRE